MTNPIEANFNAACILYAKAAADVKRSRSAVNVAAFRAASDAHFRAMDAWHAEQDRLERAETVARRLEAVAPRRALRDQQLDFFGI